MNVNISIDCTPEEARRFMGLPDMAPIHDLYLDKLKTAMSEGMTPEMLNQMLRSWVPMGEAGVQAWKTLFDQMSSIGTATTRP